MAIFFNYILKNLSISGAEISWPGGKRTFTYSTNAQAGPSTSAEAGPSTSAQGLVGNGQPESIFPTFQESLNDNIWSFLTTEEQNVLEDYWLNLTLEDQS